MSSIFWYQTYEMCACLNRSYSLSCSTWGQEGPRPAQTFAGLSGRCWAVPSPLAAPQLQPPSPAPGTWDPTDAGSSYWPTSLTIYLHVKRCHCPFPRRMCLIFSVPLLPFCIFDLQLFKGSLPLQFLPLCRLFLETEEPGGGLKFRGVNCSRSGKLFPLVCSFFLHLSSGDLRGPTPIALLVPGQAEADAFVSREWLLPARRRAASLVAIASLLLFWVSHLAKKW